MAEVPAPQRLHPLTMSYIYKVFEHLELLWMDIWVHPYADIPLVVRGGFLVWPSLSDVVG